jgi:hypothetical protein
LALLFHLGWSDHLKWIEDFDVVHVIVINLELLHAVLLTVLCIQEIWRGELHRIVPLLGRGATWLVEKMLESLGLLVGLEHFVQLDHVAVSWVYLAEDGVWVDVHLLGVANVFDEFEV